MQTFWKLLFSFRTKKLPVCLQNVADFSGHTNKDPESMRKHANERDTVITDIKQEIQRHVLSKRHEISTVPQK